MSTAATRRSPRASSEALAWAAAQMATSDPDPSAMDAFSLYVREIARYPLLSADEERALFARLARHPSDTATRTRIVESNLRLVVFVSTRYRNALRAGGAVDVMDLIQQGNDGLMHAVEKYDYRRGGRFSTYAIRWIVQRMGRARDEDAAPVHVPAYVRDAKRKIEREWASLTMQLGREPTAAEKRLAAAGAQAQLATHNRAVPDDYLMAAEAVTRGVYSLDAPLRTQGTESDPVTLADVLRDPAGGMLGGALDAAQEAWLAQQVARVCTPRECRVIGLRFGMSMTLEQAGREMGVTRERVRQVEATALTKLRTALTVDVGSGEVRVREWQPVAPEPEPKSEPVDAPRWRVWALLNANPAATVREVAAAAGGNTSVRAAGALIRAWRAERDAVAASAERQAQTVTAGAA